MRQQGRDLPRNDQRSRQAGRMFPEIYQDWGDDMAYSLQLGRGECAA